MVLEAASAPQRLAPAVVGTAVSGASRSESGSIEGAPLASAREMKCNNTDNTNSNSPHQRCRACQIPSNLSLLAS